MSNGSAKRERGDVDSSSDENCSSTKEMFKQLLDKFSKLNTRIDTLENKLDGKLNTLKTDLDEKLSRVSDDIGAVKKSCEASIHQLQSFVNKVDEKVCFAEDAIDRKANSWELIVSGVPYMSNENLTKYFVDICLALGYDQTRIPSVDLRRLSKNALPDGSPCLLLIQFAFRNHRDDFFASYFRKRDLNLRLLGFNSDRRIFINENLTLNARKIKNAALTMKKEGKLSSVYSKAGIIYVKQREGSNPVAITQLGQLNEL